MAGMTDFEKSVEFVLRWEGGYVNDPDDPGGETNWGISKRSYPHLEIKNLTREEAIEIYRKDFWEASGCQAQEWPVNLVFFDTAVHLGVKKAAFLFAISRDWRDMLIWRIKEYASFTNTKWLRGWLKRCVALWEYARKGT